MKKTPYTAAEEFTAELSALGFTVRKPDPQCAWWDAKNEAGHLVVRVCIDFEGELGPQSLKLFRFNGERGQLVEWASDLSGHAPSEGILALIRAALA